MTNEAITRVTKLPCWNGETDIQALSGGMTNLNFKVSNQGKQFVVRLGDDLLEHLVWRDNEGASSLAAAALGFSPNVVHREKGVLVIDFIEGQVFQEEDVRNPDNLPRLITTLKQFHQQMPSQFASYPALFWVFQVLRHYRNQLEQKNSHYCKQVSERMQIAESLEKTIGAIDLVFGHNDLLPANFIDDGNKIWLIDFDYAGFNSPLFDLANLASNCELPEPLEQKMLEQYFEIPADEQLWQRYNAMKCASLLREEMWSMVSEHHSKLDFDFVPYTQQNSARFERAHENYQRRFL